MALLIINPNGEELQFVTVRNRSQKKALVTIMVIRVIPSSGELHVVTVRNYSQQMLICTNCQMNKCTKDNQTRRIRLLPL